jgi:hypothetical protein
MIVTLALATLRLVAFPPAKLQACLPNLGSNSKRKARITLEVLQKLTSSSCYLYLLTLYFYFFVYSNFNIQSFNTNETSTQNSPGLWAGWVTSIALGLLAIYLDYGMNSKQVFLAADDEDAANRTRENALKAATRPVSRPSSMRQFVLHTASKELRPGRRSLLENTLINQGNINKDYSSTNSDV